MLNHHIQKSIIYKLALSSPIRFSDLKPDDIDNKLFTYHLKIVIGLGLVIKDQNGLYLLSSKGKTLGVHVFSEVQNIFNRARPELLLAIRRNDSWLMYKRNNEPFKDRVGFMHCEPVVGQDLNLVASDYLLKTCGIKGSFIISGSGITASYIGAQLENYISFTVLKAEISLGEISANDPHAEYFWLNDKDIDKQQLLPSMPDILTALSKDRLFFIDQTYRL